MEFCPRDLRKMMTFIFVVFLCGFFVNLTYAATYMCGTNGVNDSCTISGLNTLISGASDGDTINIATGTHSWIPGASTYVNVNKRVTISGGGRCPNCGTSNPTNGASWPVRIDLPSSNEYSPFRISVTSAGSSRVRITGIHFTGDTYKGGMGGIVGGFITIPNTNIAHYRIDNNRFAQVANNTYYADVWSYTWAYGLYDHNYHNPAYAEGKVIVLARMHADEWEGDCQDSWVDPVEWGSANFTFIEDSTLIRPNYEGPVFGQVWLDTICGARFVFRHNYQQNAFSEFHGQSFGTNTRSGYAAELYSNTSHCTRVGGCFRFFWNRGGTTLVYNNVHTGTLLGNTFYQTSLPLGPNGRGSWGGIDGTKDWDGNCQAGSSNPNATEPADCGQAGVPYPTGYPVLDQVGRGQSSGTTSTTIQPQKLEPARMWNNSHAGSSPHAVSSSQSDYITLNRDFYYCADTSCPWVSSFTATYTPYTYPHPLASTPAPPKNLVILER